jgi:hypothetical protein
MGSTAGRVAGGKGSTAFSGRGSRGKKFFGTGCAAVRAGELRAVCANPLKRFKHISTLAALVLINGHIFYSFPLVLSICFLPSRVSSSGREHAADIQVGTPRRGSTKRAMMNQTARKTSTVRLSIIPSMASVLYLCLDEPGLEKFHDN